MNLPEVVQALEDFIVAVVNDVSSDDVVDAIVRDEARKRLLDVLDSDEMAAE